MVPICIFLKSCTTIKKLYNKRKKLYIFGTLFLALNFIDNGVSTKMYSFFPKLYKSRDPHIYIFFKSCTTIKKLYIFTLTADCQSVKRQPQHASHCQWQSVAAAFVLFFANGTNIVANWVRKRHKIKEDSGNIFKIANIGKRKHN